MVGIACIEPVVLEQRTNAYKAWVRRITDEQGIPVMPAPPKGVRTEDFVQPYYRSMKGAAGVACVLTSMEQGSTFVSSTPRWKVASGDANYRQIKACRKRFLHYYWYCAARRLVVSPAQPGGTRREVPGSQWLTRIREVNGTIACQQSDDQVQVLD